MLHLIDSFTRSHLKNDGKKRARASIGEIDAKRIPNEMAAHLIDGKEMRDANRCHLRNDHAQ